METSQQTVVDSAATTACAAGAADEIKQPAQPLKDEAAAAAHTGDCIQTGTAVDTVAAGPAAEESKQDGGLESEGGPTKGKNADESEGKAEVEDNNDEDEEEEEEEDDEEFQVKPQPNLNKVGLNMPDFFDQLESQWVGSFNQRMAVPYKDYPAHSPLGKINWNDFALVEDEENIRKGHHAVCPQVRCRKTGKCYRCKIVSCSRIYFNLTTLGFKASEYDEEIRSYLQERQFLFAFDHPFIRSGLGFFTDANFNFGVFLEDFPHGTLADYYEKEENGKIVCHFKEEAVRMLAAQAILALEYLHCVGCVHRDIQASNVLVDARGYIKLTDFAITAPLKPGERLYSVTCFRYYAAPEYFNEKGYGYPVDFYALGLMLYEQLTQECFTDQDDIFDCDGSVDWGILPEELAALLRERRQAEMEASGASAEEAANNANQASLLPLDHVVPSEAARSFVDDCLIYEPEFRPDRNSARFYDWFDSIDFEQLYRKTLELPWRPDRLVSYQAKPDEEHPLSLVLDEKPVPSALEPYTHLF